MTCDYLLYSRKTEKFYPLNFPEKNDMNSASATEEQEAQEGERPAVEEPGFLFFIFSLGFLSYHAIYQSLRI